MILLGILPNYIAPGEAEEPKIFIMASEHVFRPVATTRNQKGDKETPMIIPLNCNECMKPYKN